MKQELQLKKVLDTCQWHSNFHNGFARIKRNGMYGFVHVSGRIITPKYSMVYDFQEGRARVKLNNRFAYIDELGNEITEFRYNSAQDFDKKGQAIVSIGNLCGIINKQGKEKIPVENVSLEKYLS